MAALCESSWSHCDAAQSCFSQLRQRERESKLANRCSKACAGSYTSIHYAIGSKIKTYTMVGSVVS